MTHAPGPKSWRRTVMVLSTILLVLALAAAVARSPLSDEADGAARFVRGFGDQAIAMLSDPALGSQEREREFRRLLTKGFHLDAIGRFVLGRHWRRASEEQRREFQKLFEDYFIASYARQISGYAGEQLLVEGSLAQGKHGALVTSHITRPQGEPLRVEWRLRRVDDSWRIIDVVVKGISMVVTHRTEFSSVIGSHGGRIDGLLEVLRSRNAHFEAQAPADSIGTM